MSQVEEVSKCLISCELSVFHQKNLHLWIAGPPVVPTFVPVWADDDDDDDDDGLGKGSTLQ